MRKYIQITSIILFSLMGAQLIGISDLLFSLDDSVELFEIEDSDTEEKEEKDEKEEDVNLFNSSHSLLLLNQNTLINNFKFCILSLNQYFGTETPPPEYV